jgi:antitoxin (DNA-binding transcriptional repressor) of toxin-antitoxin stability system
MAVSIDIHHLGAMAERLVREAHARGQAVVVTDGGEPIARIDPLPSVQPPPEAGATLLADLQRFAADIETWWPADTTAVDAVREVRRDL